ncbi:MAG: hypothetical protein AVDCRST_MAG16-162, partial [uncultured Frankineae bacterium]
GGAGRRAACAPAAPRHGGAAGLRAAPRPDRGRGGRAGAAVGRGQAQAVVRLRRGGGLHRCATPPAPAADARPPHAVRADRARRRGGLVAAARLRPAHRLLGDGPVPARCPPDGDRRGCGHRRPGRAARGGAAGVVRRGPAGLGRRGRRGLVLRPARGDRQAHLPALRGAHRARPVDLAHRDRLPRRERSAPRAAAAQGQADVVRHAEPGLGGAARRPAVAVRPHPGRRAAVAPDPRPAVQGHAEVPAAAAL